MINKHLILFLLAGIAMQLGWSQKTDTISIENVNVIPMTEEIVVPNQRVVIAGGKILKIEPATTPLAYKATLVIDGTGKYLIPGLSEMHYHWRNKEIQNDFKLFIANGITTVRNMSESPGQDHVAIKQKLLSGKLMGPNYFTTGPYLKAKDLQSEEQVMQVVKLHKEKGYDFIKLADNLPKNIYLKLLAEAQAGGIPVIGHAQRNLPVEYSFRMKSIEHIEEFLYITDEKTGQTFFKEDVPAMERLAQQVRDSKITIGTTLVVFDFITKCLDDKKFALLQQDSLKQYLAKEERESFLTEKNDYRKLRNSKIDGINAPALFDAYFDWMKRFTRILSDKGVSLLTGSDTYGMVIVGFSLHKEFELLQQTGIRPYDILLASTVHPARYLNTYPLEGTVTEGKNANLVLLNKNPLENISNTKTIEGVLLHGQWFDKKQLDKMLRDVATAFK